jgi:hypothetical protein
VVSVSKSVVDNFPSTIVSHQLFVNQNAHQLYGSDVIKLDLILGCELGPILIVSLLVAPNNVAHGSRAEEILLLQAKLLAALT